MHEDWVVCAFVPLGEAQLFIGERVNPMLVCLLVSQWKGRRGKYRNPAQSVSSPSEPQSGTKPGAVNSGSLNTSAMIDTFGSSVKVSSHKVDLEKLHVLV